MMPIPNSATRTPHTISYGDDTTVCSFRPAIWTSRFCMIESDAANAQHKHQSDQIGISPKMPLTAVPITAPKPKNIIIATFPALPLALRTAIETIPPISKASATQNPTRLPEALFPLGEKMFEMLIVKNDAIVESAAHGANRIDNIPDISFHVFIFCTPKISLQFRLLHHQQHPKSHFHLLLQFFYPPSLISWLLQFFFHSRHKPSMDSPHSQQ